MRTYRVCNGRGNPYIPLVAYILYRGPPPMEKGRKVGEIK